MHQTGALVLKELIVFVRSLVPCNVQHSERSLRTRLQVMGRSVRPLINQRKPLVKKKHHFRPAAHLRLFTDNTGRLWVTDKSRGKQFQQIPDKIGYEKLLYAPGDGPDPSSDSVEEWLANVVDGPGSNALRKAAQLLPLDNAERSALARFIAAQDFRTPVARDLLVLIFQRSLDSQWEAWKRTPAASVGG